MTLAEIGKLAVTARTLRRQTNQAHKDAVDNRIGFGSYKEVEAQAVRAEKDLATAIDQFTRL